jgi:hypothetical protein
MPNVMKTLDQAFTRIAQGRIVRENLEDIPNG